MKTNEEILEIIKNKDISFATVSGIITTNMPMIKRMDRIPEISIITTKSFTVEPREGNREPILFGKDNSFINAVGLKNPGMEKAYYDIKASFCMSDSFLKSILNISLAGNTIEDFVILIKKFNDVADMFELNFSCPHVNDGYGMAIGANSDTVFEYLTEIRKHTNKLIFVKLTPNTNEIEKIAKAAIKGGANGIIAINTIGPYDFLDKKGSMSGKNIKEIALNKVKKIRKAIGPFIPIIGMGGISNGKDVKNMIEAGANIVGIGSALANIHPDNWKQYFYDLKNNNEVKNYTKNINTEYTSYKITKIEDFPDEIRMIELDGKVDYKASQFVFLYLPEIGEKPFSIYKGDPLTFLFKKKGKFTKVIFNLNVGDEIYYRGVYGEKPFIPTNSRIAIVAGGTGIAVAEKLTYEFSKKNNFTEVFHGMTKYSDYNFSFPEQTAYIPVVDNGIFGRVINVFSKDAIYKKYDYVYTIGSNEFMKKVSKTYIENEGKKEDIFLSVETLTRCGIGLCGECQCGGKLTCKEGTFFTYKNLKENE